MKTSSSWNRLFEAFCKSKNLQITYDPALRRSAEHAYLPYEKPADAQDEHDNASHMIRKIIELNNKEKQFIPDYLDADQYKWFPVGRWTETGLVFSHTYYESWNSFTNAFVGAPFVSPTWQEAERIFKEFLPIYEKYFYNPSK